VNFYIYQQGCSLKLLILGQPPSDQEAYTQTLGRLIYESCRFEGIRYPFATVKQKWNLAIFPDRLKKQSEIHVYDSHKLVTQEIKGKN